MRTGGEPDLLERCISGWWAVGGLTGCKKDGELGTCVLVS